MQNLPMVEIYTDGACSGNPGPGGWGALLKYGNVAKEIYGYLPETTNNQMEILAAIEALKLLKKPCQIKLYTDSKYLQKGITEWVHKWQKNNWRKSNNEPVKNLNLWQDLQKQITIHNVIWIWVKGHGNNEGNCIADALAARGRDIAKKELGCR
jgi:ribonuclease HI